MKIINTLKYWVIAALTVCSAGLLADDTDLFDVGSLTAPAKIMLVVDTSGSMSWMEGERLADVSDYFGDCTGTFEYERTIGAQTDTVTLNNADRKLCILKSVLLPFLDPDVGDPEMTWPDNFQVGLARYEVPTAKVLAAVSPLGSAADPNSHRNQLISAINGLSADGYTPIMGSYLEVANYLTSETIVNSNHARNLDSSLLQDGSNVLYKGPDLGPQCNIVNNHIVFLTDGASTQENLASGSYIYSGTLGERANEFLTGEYASGVYHTSCPATASTVRRASADQESQLWDCVHKIADDLLTRSVSRFGTDVNESVKTHVIAYDLGGDESEDLRKRMRDWAKIYGGGEFVSATNGQDIADAFDAITSEAVLTGTYTVASGGVGINQTNRFTHLDEMYFSMFTPSSKPFWYGNLKKYYFDVSAEGELGIYTNPEKSTVAVEDGVFQPGVESPWTEGFLVPAYYNTNTMQRVDGDIAHIGGAASHIKEPGSRKLYAYYGGVRYRLQPDDATAAAQDIDQLRDTLLSEYTAMLADPMSADAVAAISNYTDDVLNPSLNWLLGIDVGDDEWTRIAQYGDLKNRLANPVAKPEDRREVRDFYGAPLHSSPVLVNYKTYDASGNALTNPENVVFLSTNDGKLYAVDSDTGEEHLAYIPEAMLKRPSLTDLSPVQRMYNATKATAADGNLLYGLDSTWSVWRQDVNHNGNIDEGTLDFVYLYGGMRRGGRNYYILDATNVQNSETISEIAVLEGGTGPFLNNGQSWSEPRLAIIKYKGTPTAVFIIGGGYDVAYDSGRPETLPAKGAQVYIVAARAFTVANSNETHSAGDVLWWASAESVGGDASHVQIDALQYSIPSSVKSLDKDGDGFLDHFYVGDMGGQVLRFDINNANTGAANLISNASDVVIAQLGVAGQGTIADGSDRRFFYPPSVALMQCPQGNCVALAMGSGWRSNPTDVTVDEKFYFLWDYEPYGANQAIINETATVTGSTAYVVQALAKTDDADSITAASTDAGIRGYSLALGGTGFDAEKLLGSPLIVGGDVYFSTYYRPPEGGASNVCQVGVGASAIYEFHPGDAQVEVLDSGLSQNVAGSIQALISEIEPTLDPPVGGGGDEPSPEVNGGIISGTGSVGKAPIRLDVIRKTRWLQLDQ